MIELEFGISVTTVWQLIRYALLLAFGPLLTKGYISSDQVTTTLGALGALFTVGWGIWVKFGTKATTAAVAANPAVHVISAATGKVQ